MNINNFFQFLVPKDKKFFPLFEEASSNLIEIATNLHEAVNLPLKEREVLFQKIDVLEQKGEDITRQTNLELSRNFITPFDREDIHSLATALDDIADYIYATAKKINFYKIEPTNDQGIKKMADAIKESVLSVNSAVIELRNLKNIQKVVECVIKINGIENQVDDIFDLSIENLFENETDIKTLIKKREIYQVMEEVTDKCEDAGNVMESIVVKYA